MKQEIQNVQDDSLQEMYRLANEQLNYLLEDAEQNDSVELQREIDSIRRLKNFYKREISKRKLNV